MNQQPVRGGSNFEPPNGQSEGADMHPYPITASELSDPYESASRTKCPKQRPKDHNMHFSVNYSGDSILSTLICSPRPLNPLQIQSAMVKYGWSMALPNPY